VRSRPRTEQASGRNQVAYRSDENKDLVFAKDGSLTVYVQSQAPSDREQRMNWLPAPSDDFSLYVRAYWPKSAVTDGSWTPPPIEKRT